MKSYPFVWPYGLAFWIVYVWVFIPEFRVVFRAQRHMSTQRRDPSQARAQDAGSMGVIVLGMWVGMGVAFAVAHITRFMFPEPAAFILYWAGVVLLGLASLLRRHCFRVLGEYFTGDVVVRADQVVIDRGAYRFVRHPSYTAGILMFLAIGLALGSWLSTLIAFTSAVAVYVYRVRVEERALVSTLGEPYRAFMRSRKRFIPFII